MAQGDLSRVQQKWTAAAHVGCGRPTILFGGARLRLVEPPAGRACDLKRRGTRGNHGFTRDRARGGNIVSPTLEVARRVAGGSPQPAATRPLARGPQKRSDAAERNEALVGYY